jgi:hypothetical protein
MMSKEFEDIKYALFPRTVKYKLSDGMMLTTKGISIEVETANTSSTDFRAAMAEKWQGLIAKLVGLYGVKPLFRLAAKGTWVML